MDPNKKDKIIMDDADGQDPGSETAGMMVRTARERAGLSREALAGKVNLLLNQISALEDDNYARLAGPMFVRGYLRSIARALQLNESILLATYERSIPAAQCAQPKVQALAADKPMRPIVLGRVSSARRHWGLVAAALVVAGLWGWQARDQSPGLALSLTPDSVNGETKPLPGGIEDALAGNAQTRLLDSVELLPASNTDAGVSNAASAAAAPNTDTAVAHQQLAFADSKTITAEGDQLSLRFSADCWVEIKDRDNRVLVAALKHSNERLQLQGKGPFRVLLGFAPGVEMAYNGTPVNIEVSQGSRSARLIVGSS